ncbi:MAG: FAD-dependent oxidoreductase [Stappia sp.]|uniref:NAD(P)/FAD-dependent oxidoreductase n=1 Tax=Stappia sp. TaxID=1870903 RepID=UPI000C4076EE|nr:FAD-binding oxidoreductase [Stappia sp.]MAA97341.1 FAD-dependent oxidoreductase [Stappia sp.]MBM18502.1 FAD-dependent oxidoreductase [Stappia sp.]
MNARGSNAPAQADHTVDVAIVGGAVTGSSIACHLAMDPDWRGSVLVVEKDPSYARCASALSAASIRQQFSTAVNIEISLYGIAFLREIGSRLEAGGERPAIDLHEGGYLFLATPDKRSILEENHALQARLGADIAFLEPDALAARFPWLNVEDISAGCFGHTGEGWFDGYGLMQAFRKKARALGVPYLAAEVAETAREGEGFRLTLSNGETVSCGRLVDAAGASGARKIAADLGVTLPLESRKRMIFTFDCREEVKGCPLLIDPNGTYVRPEGTGFLCGSAPATDPESHDFKVEHGFFEDHLWPTLAARIPAFEAIRPGAAWAGHYDMNLYDHNALLGEVGDVPGFYLATGFSGHGLQQAPAVGRGIAELLVHGAYRSLDLSALGFDRLAQDRPVSEKNVV